MKNITTLITSLILFASVPVAFAWTAAPKNPPKDNVPAPITVGDSDQNKQGKLGLGGLAVFGKLQLIDGTQGVGKVLVSDANGKASWAPMAGVGSGTTVSSGGQPIVCGGWDVKYGTSGAINEWGCASGASCPAGYDTIKSSKVTINLAEQTNLCVLSRAGGGGGPVITSGGTLASGEKSFGSDWTMISLTGSYNSTDAGAAGGYIYKSGGKTMFAIAEATGFTKSGEVTSSYQCAYTFCVKSTGGDVTVKTGNNSFAYVVWGN